MHTIGCAHIVGALQQMSGQVQLDAGERRREARRGLDQSACCACSCSWPTRAFWHSCLYVDSMVSRMVLICGNRFVQEETIFRKGTKFDR